MTFNEKYKNNILLIKSFSFALNIIDYTELLESKRKFILANQILKSGTSIGANSKEAQNAESKADFIHKLKIAVKEADETEYWLFLCDAHPSYPDCKELLSELSEIIKILNKIIATTKIG
jgi:four helix bundle protein